MMPRQFDRRRFLRAAGVTLALPLLDGVRSLSGKEKASQTPRRMLLISNNLGVLPKSFFPKSNGRDYELSPYLQDLADCRNDFTVISGLARGIDTAAHEGALASKGRTIAVIGAGMGKLYPPENMGLAERIAQQGAVISEFPVDYPPDKQSFPLRNRIVAGMCSGLLVVEAPVRSGSLITAGQAIEMGRTVFAVPGNIDRPTSAGCNRLIQQGAKLVMDGGDVLDDLMTLFPTAARAPVLESAPLPLNMSTDEATVFAALGTEQSHIDQITARCGLSSALVSSTLMRLEMKRLVRPLPGLRYVKLV